MRLSPMDWVMGFAIRPWSALALRPARCRRQLHCLRARWQHASSVVCGSGQPRSLGGCGFCAAAGRDPELPTRIEMKQIEIEHARNLAATLTMVAYGCEHIFIDPSDMPPLAKPSARPLRA